jgi:hypothetical protein
MLPAEKIEIFFDHNSEYKSKPSATSIFSKANISLIIPPAEVYVAG